MIKMFSRAILLCLLLFAFSNLKAQSNSQKPVVYQKTVYKTWVVTQAGFTLKGLYLHYVSDSGVFLVEEESNFVGSVYYMPFKDIKRLRFRKKNRVGKGMALGATAMFFMGGALAYADDPNNNILLSGFSFAPVGALLGAIFGSAKITVTMPTNGLYTMSFSDGLKKYSLVDEFNSGGYIEMIRIMPLPY